MKKKNGKLDRKHWVARQPEIYDSIYEWALFHGIPPEHAFDVDTDVDYWVRVLGPHSVHSNAEVSKDLVHERAELIFRLKQFVAECEHLAWWGVIPHGAETDLAPTWSDDMVTEAYNIGQILSDKTTLRRLAGFTRKSKPTKWTRELTARARKVWEDHRQEIWNARDDWNHYLDKARSDEAKQNARERIKREYPNIPERILDELLFTEPGILARELTIEELDLRRDDGELISSDRLKAILNTKADTNGSGLR